MVKVRSSVVCLNSGHLRCLGSARFAVGRQKGRIVEFKARPSSDLTHCC